MVIERNWLNVYKYTSWGGSEVPPMEPGSTFVPSELFLREGQTEPPPKLTERDLLALMDRFGIGTDATVSDHIAKQQVLSQFWVAPDLCIVNLRASGRLGCQPHAGYEHGFTI